MTTTRDTFDIEISHRNPGRNLPQQVGRKLWAPMLLMALMAFPLGVILGVWRANLVAAGGAETLAAALVHYVPAANFLGFAAVFGAISFAIARILGEFRDGGGRVQEAAGVPVHTLRMPTTAKLFILLMAMAMMILLAAVVLHVLAAAAITAGSARALAMAETWALWLEGVRRLGIALYLVAITLGLATIIEVLRFQAIRVRELPEQRRAAT